MSRAVRVGVVGAGVIAQRGIVPHLAEEDVRERVRMEAICDPVPGRAESVAARFGIPAHYQRYEDMLDQAAIDAVTIASPIGLHYEQGKAALSAGKHVHFNKTMCTTVAEANDLIELARSRGLKIVASPGEVLRPHHREIRRILDSGRLGTVSWALCGTAPGDYHVDERERAAPGEGGAILPDWYFQRPGGGPLYDTTVYPLHALTSVLGPAVRVTAMSGIRLPARKVTGDRVVQATADDTTLMILDFGDALFASIYGVTYGRVNEGHTVSYFGSAGSIVGRTLNGQPLEYPERLSDASPQAELPHVRDRHRDMPEAHVFEDVMQLADWVRDDVSTPVTAEHARHVIDIIESAYRSAQHGRTEELTTSFRLEPSAV